MPFTVYGKTLGSGKEETYERTSYAVTTVYALALHSNGPCVPVLLIVVDQVKGRTALTSNPGACPVLTKVNRPYVV